MITTKSFTFKNPEEQFRATLEEFYDYNEVQYNKELLDEAAAYLWFDYGDDIEEHISGAVTAPINNWQDERQICLAVLEEYLMDEDREDYTFEEFWNNLMFYAMSANKDSLLTYDPAKPHERCPEWSIGNTLYVYGTNDVVEVVAVDKDDSTGEFVYTCYNDKDKTNKTYKYSQLAPISKDELEDKSQVTVYEYEDKRYIKVYSFDVPDAEQCSLCCFHAKAGEFRNGAPIFICKSPFKKTYCREDHGHWEEEK